MSYQVIARKWRPQEFAQLVGQDPIAQTLLNSLRNNRLHHAILFTGPRGTGKTSTARILAKSLRCPEAKNNDWVPCQKCETCLEVAQGRNVDVIEIDGASNNGVDSIRELRETVGYMPSSGSYKVYIIDEVHMLSISAFNALLKTLEEPPAHVIFLMATTEVHKIPQTILSRCQRFDFRRIPTKKIQEHLQKICSEEQIPAEAEALWLIARHGDGSMRDSQSLLEQVITFSKSELTKVKVTEILGLTDRQLIYDILEAILNRDAASIIQILERYQQMALEPHLLIQDVLESLRHLTVIKVVGSSPILDLPDVELNWLKERCEKLSQEELHYLFDITLKGTEEVIKAVDSRLVLEMVLLRLATAPRIPALKDFLHSLKNAGAITHSVQSGAQATSQRNSNSGQVGSGSTASVSTTSAPTASQLIAQPQASSQTSMQSQTQAYSQGPNQSSSQTSVSSQAQSQGSPQGLATNQPEAPQKPAVSAPLTPIANRTSLSSEERWLCLVDEVKKQDILLGSKLEGMFFLGQDGKTLNLGIPAKLQFLRQQFQDANFVKKVQGFIDQLWGSGYVFNAQVVKDKEKGFSVIGAEEEKKQQQGDKLREEIESHPAIKAAQSVFNTQIVDIKDITTPK
jgi:DNA polymerase-3 subunit gamma/tau